MKYIHSLLLCVLLTSPNTSIPDTSIEATENREVMGVWILSILSHEVVGGISKPFLDHLAAQTGRNYRTIASTNVPDLLASCKSSPPPLVAVSITVAKRLEASCGYRYIAVSYQNINLLVNINSSDQASKTIHRVGLIKNIKATTVAQKELPEMHPNAQQFIYKDIFGLVMRARKDNIDAIVIPQTFLKSAPEFEKDWKSIYTFKDKGSAAIMVSPLLGSDLVGRIQEIFLKNEPITKSVWQDKFGLGPFVNPTELQGNTGN